MDPALPLHDHLDNPLGALPAGPVHAPPPPPPPPPPAGWFLQAVRVLGDAVGIIPANAQVGQPAPPRVIAIRCLNSGCARLTFIVGLLLLSVVQTFDACLFQSFGHNGQVYSECHKSVSTKANTAASTKPPPPPVTAITPVTDGPCDTFVTDLFVRSSCPPVTDVLQRVFHELPGAVGLQAKLISSEAVTARLTSCKNAYVDAFGTDTVCCLSTSSPLATLVNCARPTMYIDLVRCAHKKLQCG